MPNNYTAIAIGPVYKTMAQARKTRHLWGASYLFSYIMKQLIKKLLESKVVTENDILLPHSTEALRNGTKFYGTGLFPDRLFIQVTDTDKAESEIESISQKIIEEITVKAGNEFAAYFEAYFRIYYANYSLPDENIKIFPKEADNSNIVMVGNKLLDLMELKEKYHNDISQVDWQKIIDKLNGKGLLYKDAFGNVKDDYQFPYLLEIATDDFRKRNKAVHEDLVKQFLGEETEDEQETFLKALDKKSREEDNPFGSVRLKAYHKYIAVVQADGDNIGKTIGNIGNDPQGLKNFSEALGAFAIAATQEIKDYGGKPVYVGGDDLLFFAPVAVNNNENSLETIFGLINKIDKIFKEKVIESDKLRKIYEPQHGSNDPVVSKPSLSYGVSVTYTKYPLNEARDSAYHLMKEAKAIKDDKNKICFKILKHSGQGLGFTIEKKMFTGDSKHPKSFDTFLSMTTRIPLEKHTLASVIYKLHPVRHLINEVASDKARLSALFENTFNEPVHKEGKVGAYLKKIEAFIHQLYVDFKDDIEPLPDYETETRKSNLQKIYSTLRFVKFVTDDINE